MKARRSHLGLVVLAVALTAVACSRKPAEDRVPAPASTASQPSGGSPPSALDRWPGTWNGPEGTYLKLVAQGNGKYEVAIRNLDGERRFAGVGSSDRISFKRDGKQEEIRATDGNATGMKWLAGKTTCLTVRAGEGYCRE